MKKLSCALLLIACLCLLPSCNPEMPAPSTARPASAPADTPRDLLTRLEAANAAWDYEALLACMEPTDRHNFQYVLNESKRYTDKIQQVRQVVRGRIGEEHARKFRESVFPGIFTSPLGDASRNGHPVWSKIHISINSDLASVRSDAPNSMDFKLRRVDGQWYLTPEYYLRRPGKDGLTWYTKEFDRHIQVLDGVEADVESGMLNKGNFDKRFEKPKKE